ncbi:type II secretion system F family protein [Methylobacter sp. YRD-M1]|uniref:type II secretion system F family protein n=1 Tax=Methylobacter sp. YRD-M1 TaxID=2911520 RepID=UPI00227B9010|nr:type II secretion system F family protein [Methylobacter sp. YRD-M1]WAK03278.1 type II secretion system F family protein [Methylobacter sp. YRD-M1]
MPVFTYLARDRSGQQRTDAIESATRESAILALREQGLLPLKIEELKKDGGVKSFSLNPFAYRAFSASDIEHEFHQIAVMLRSGISLLDALSLTQKYCRIGARPTWERLAKRIQQGSSFKDALSEHKAFSEFTIQLIHVGEQTGHLSTVLDEAAKEVKSSRKLKKQIVTALRYPAFTLLFAIGLVIFMLTSIIPEIKKLLQIMGKPMPPVTQALIDTSDWMLANGLTMAVLAIASIVAFIVLYSLPTSRWLIDKWALKLPLFGYVLRLSGTVLFSRAMGLLLRSGVVMVDALETMEKLHVNKYMASRIAFARSRVLQGSSLADPLETESGYMPLLLQMTRIGENSGMLDDILFEMTEYHDELLQQAIATLTGMIAPLMTIFVGGVVGFVYAAFLVAMFSAAGGSPT